MKLEATTQHEETQEETVKVDLRCCLCFQKNKKRADGSYRPHTRLSVKGMKKGSTMVECFGYTRANATRGGAVS